MEDQNVVGEMNSGSNTKRHRVEQQRTEKAEGLWRRASSCSGRTQPRSEQNRTVPASKSAQADPFLKFTFKVAGTLDNQPNNHPTKKHTSTQPNSPKQSALEYKFQTF